ncbi:MAG: hypothetical protein M3Y57_21735 [Acidobacteriota bacterium]|nr:hypothetical protein [Acidobacteriota bacterium]
MILPLRICSKWLAIAAFSAATQGATIVGSVVTIPPVHGEQMSEIIVWLQRLHPSVSEAPTEHAQLVQKNKMFHPHVLAVRTGTIIDFPNFDPIFHNAFSNYDGQLFDVGLYPPGSSRSIRFRHPGIVRVFCNIHPSMSAVILVLDTPFFTRARANGRFDLASVPPGEYELHAFDERAADPADVVSVNVPSDTSVLDAPPIRLSEASYVQRPHKNKYGREYPPQRSENGYGGVLK